jgi:outer membrane protein assembly factor BamB
MHLKSLSDGLLSMLLGHKRSRGNQLPPHCGFRPLLMPLLVLSQTVWSLNALPARAADWPQFRGPNASGITPTSQPLPTHIGPDQGVKWKTELPPGHSSPVIVGDRIFLTAVKNEQLVTIGLERATGRVLWEQTAPTEQRESIHRIGSHAQSSPAADANLVVSFFGSVGLLAYDHDGRSLWQRQFGPFKNSFGAASSPILHDQLVILGQDHDTDSFLMALDKTTGETVWKTDRSEFPRNYCTPIIWTTGGRTQIVMAATLRAVGYDLATGHEAWTVRGLSRTVCMTPVIGDDNTLYVAGWAAGGDENEPITIDPLEQVLPMVDSNQNGSIEESELTEGPVLQRFSQADRDKDGHLTAAEYNQFRELFSLGKNVIVAIPSQPPPRDEATETHVRWRQTKLVPFCSSPLWYQGLLVTVKDGGLFQALDSATGKPVKQSRLEANGDYYASPVAGDGKIYMVDEQGRLTVVQAAAPFGVLHTADFGVNVYATPALVDGQVYLRTADALYCF